MRILVLEDEKKMSGFLERGLKEQGYGVDVAATQAQALENAVANEYDLMILDIMLPDGSGLEVAQTVRSQGYMGPILMLTALSTTKDKVHGLDAGADDYLVKPFAFDELLARVRALLRRQGGSSVQLSLLQYDAIQMDLVHRKVTRQNEVIDLTNKEFALLEYFLRNPERPLSRTQITEHVWDMSFDPGSNVVDVYVNMLRKKIDIPFPDRLIQTIVGYGYELNKNKR